MEAPPERVTQYCHWLNRDGGPSELPLAPVTALWEDRNNVRALPSPASLEIQSKLLPHRFAEKGALEKAVRELVEAAGRVASWAASKA